MVITSSIDLENSHTSCLICSKRDITPITLRIGRKNGNGNVNSFNVCAECLREMSDDLIKIVVSKGGNPMSETETERDEAILQLEEMSNKCCRSCSYGDGSVCPPQSSCTEKTAIRIAISALRNQSESEKNNNAFVQELTEEFHNEMNCMDTHTEYDVGYVNGWNAARNVVRKAYKTNLEDKAE